VQTKGPDLLMTETGVTFSGARTTCISWWTICSVRFQRTNLV